ncbi:MAG TPA: 16S rRNA (guanine(527)-N(7))-methyltransferase RsmG [Gammaproteobacteria bacterium]|nr:16S rRNA (guanine(527)-N(7))-methyltransferase RsmG [Gammaproteobacteria bacterium]
MIGPATDDTLHICLNSGLQKLGLDLDESQRDTCLAYLDLLGEWNRAYNLTAIREPSALVAYHLLDSLAVLPFLHGKQCLDVGTGAGLPGLILALADRDRHWRLIDSNRKRLRFVNQAILELKLPNVETLHVRVEDLEPEDNISTITVRAYGRLGRIWRDAGHLVGSGTHLLAMKSSKIKSELAELASLPVKYRVHEIDVPGLDADRILIEIRRITEDGDD